MITITPDQEARLTELEGKKTDGSITAEEEAVRVALLELDEKVEALDEAKAANPVPDPVQVAQDAVDVAQKALDEAEQAASAA